MSHLSELSTAASPFRVLLVEDDQDDYLLTRDLLQEALGAAELRIDWVATGDLALAQVSDNDYDLIVLDYYLGAMNGAEVAQAITEDPAATSAPILVLTGLEDAEADAAVLNSGASDYLVKHELTPKLLRRAVRYSLHRKQCEQELRDLAMNDALTGVTNRLGFSQTVQVAIAQAARADAHMAMILLDLDRFKAVNDTFGHSIGDALLREVASRIQSVVRQTDTVARLGGDEFVVLANQLKSMADAAICADKILKSLAQPIVIDGKSMQVYASAGISLFPEDGMTPELLFDSADVALYQAKDGGRGHFRFYDPAQDLVLHAQNRFRADLTTAVEERNIDVFYQPIVDAETGVLRGLEALARWEDQARGFVPPGIFVKTAESTGLIHSLGDIVLESACEMIAKMRKRLRHTVPVSVNVSGLQIAQPRFLKLLELAVDKWDIEPGELRLELTESVFLESSESADLFYQRARDLGIALAVDDFGAGYSSLGYLQRIPAKTIKVGRELSAKYLENHGGLDVMKAIVSLAKALHCEVVIEGIESEYQWERAKECGCDMVQGYLFSRPISADEALAQAQRPHLELVVD